MALATECTEKELKILKDQVRALHVSKFRQFVSKNWLYYKQTRTPPPSTRKKEKLNCGSIQHELIQM